MSRLAVLLVISFGFVAGCDSSAADEQFRVTLQPGASRLYAYESTLTDSSGVASTIAQDTIRTRVVATGQSVEGMDGLTEVEYTSVVTGAATRTWYRQESGQLVDVAYEHNLTALAAELRMDPETSLRPLQFLAGSVVGGGGNGEVIVREDPRIVLTYPLEVGAEWISFTNPFFSERRVEREELVQVPAGAFETTVISTTVGIAGNNFEWLDWLDEGGLVRRTITGEQEYTDEQGNVVGSGTFADKAILIAVE